MLRFFSHNVERRILNHISQEVHGTLWLPSAQQISGIMGVPCDLPVKNCKQIPEHKFTPDKLKDTIVTNVPHDKYI